MKGQENQPLLSTVNDSDTSLSIYNRKCLSGSICSTLGRFCQRYKAVLLILVWTMIVGELLMVQKTLIGCFIDNYVPTGINHFSNSVSSPLAFAYAILAVIAMFYPLGGFLADVCCGRFKTVMIGLCFLSFHAVVTIIIPVVWVVITQHPHSLLQQYNFKEVAPYYFVGFCAFSLAMLGIVAFQANFIQLGLVQLMDAPSISLSIFVHAAVWANVLGICIMGIGNAFIAAPELNIKVKIGSVAVLFLSLASFPFLFVFSCSKWRWFYTEPGRHNPYRNVLKVLNFVRKHKYPLYRSAFTYCYDERPSRIDFAKSRYGGPFTTEQVEDVKTFFRILMLLLSLGTIFVMEVPTSYIGFKTFRLHTGYREDFIYRSTIWALFESSTLRYMIASTFLPVYIYKVLLHRRISMFTRLYAGILLYILGTVSMLAIDLAGHLHSVNDLGTGSHCMFTYTRTNGNHTTKLRYPVLEMHWAVLIPPNVLLGIGPPIVTATVFEFISAQSPHSMKGLLIGVFFVIKGFFQLISSIALVPISSDSIWSKGSIGEHPPVTNCGFTYFLFTIVVALFGLVMFSIVVKRYKYRER